MYSNQRYHHIEISDIKILTFWPLITCTTLLISNHDESFGPIHTERKWKRKQTFSQMFESFSWKFIYFACSLIYFPFAFCFLSVWTVPYDPFTLTDYESDSCLWCFTLILLTMQTTHLRLGSERRRIDNRNRLVWTDPYAYYIIFWYFDLETYTIIRIRRGSGNLLRWKLSGKPENTKSSHLSRGVKNPCLNTDEPQVYTLTFENALVVLTNGYGR